MKLEGVWELDGTAEVPERLGGKATGLAAIARAGLAVPAAWAVDPLAPGSSIDSLGEAIRAMGIQWVAVRSSASGEDGATHSFAGIHETELGVPLERLAEAVARVSKSPLLPRAVAYRAQRGLPPGERCAVVVQVMVDAEWSGVAFGTQGGVLVEAVEGLGETAVGGDATPERIEVAGGSAGLRVARRWPRKQPFAVKAGGTGVARIALTGERPVLDDAVLLGVARGTLRLQEVFGGALDVEWIARRGEIAFVQARPQTRPLDEALPPGERWTRANAADTVPEIVSALVRAVTIQALDRMLHEFYGRCRLPLPRGVPTCAVVVGRFVFNERVFFHAGDTMGIPRPWLRLLLGGDGEAAIGYTPPEPGKLLRHLGAMARILIGTVRVEQRVRRLIDGMWRRYGSRAPAELAAPEDGALIEEVFVEGAEEAHPALLEVMWIAAAYQNQLSMGAMAIAAHPTPAALVARLLPAEPVSVSTRQLEDLMELARALRAWEGGRAFLAEVTDPLASAATWREALPTPLWQRVEEWLARFGHRCPGESDWGVPRFGEDLRMLASALRPWVLGAEEPEAATERRRRREADRQAAWAEVVARFGRIAALRLKGPVRKLGRLMRLREELRSANALRVAHGRKVMLELGRRLAERTRLDAPGDVFHLTREELERSLANPGFDAKGAVARERARIAAWRRLDVPCRFTSEEVGSFLRVGAAAEAGPNLIRATAVSPGLAEGRACVLRSVEDAAKMLAGGILVAYATDPGWTPIFSRAAAVVVELGGVMSHSATVAREYGIPCVSNVSGAVVRLRDGDLLRVDGLHGTVEILERA